VYKFRDPTRPNPTGVSTRPVSSSACNICYEDATRKLLPWNLGLKYRIGVCRCVCLSVQQHAQTMTNQAQHRLGHRTFQTECTRTECICLIRFECTRQGSKSQLTQRNPRNERYHAHMLYKGLTHSVIKRKPHYFSMVNIIYASIAIVSNNFVE